VTPCLFASDLHGRTARYERLLEAIERERPAAVFLGGDLLPPLLGGSPLAEMDADGFLLNWLAPRLDRLRRTLGPVYPKLFAIPGNDDPRAFEDQMRQLDSAELWVYLQERRAELADHVVFGYAYVPPSPFLLKDWERYDVSRFVDPGCISPEEGRRSVPIAPRVARFSTIKQDLERLLGSEPLDRAVLLLHTPPHDTLIDRAALDGKAVEHVPLDVHVGSIAVRRAIEARAPKLTLHGHVHESTRLTGSWRDRIGPTEVLSAAHDGPELALVRFRLEDPTSATRELL
jgi:Icc-related predicted phosphoesterase